MWITSGVGAVGAGLGAGFGRSAFGPPIGAIVERAEALVFFFFAGKKFGDALEAFDGFGLKRILEKDFDLDAEIFESLLGASFFGDGAGGGGLIGTCAGEAVGASGNGGCLGGAGENILEKGGIGFAFEAGDAFVIAVVVRIDIDEAIERIAGRFDLAGFEVKVEEADESIKIFRFAI